MSLIGASQTLSQRLLMIPGMKSATSEPEEQLSPEDFPAVIVYPGAGTAKLNTADNGSGHPSVFIFGSLAIDVHMDRRDMGLPQSVKLSAIYLPQVLSKIYYSFWKDKFGGNVDFLGNPKEPSVPPINFNFLHLGWGSIETIGYRFRIDVTLEQELLDG